MVRIVPLVVGVLVDDGQTIDGARHVVEREPVALVQVFRRDLVHQARARCVPEILGVVRRGRLAFRPLDRGRDGVDARVRLAKTRQLLVRLDERALGVFLRTV
ncbi:MAG: hypothetical protein GKR86_16095, partial [Ilumatobacter sp.]|nr:hypothetical protein [Ilumatobacter sp.]